MIDKRENDSGFNVKRMSLDEYASFENEVDGNVIRVGNMYWRCVRRCFLRPLIPFREYSSESITVPLLAHLGGIQYLVPEGQPSNSTISFLMFEQADKYSIDQLPAKRRKNLKHSLEIFTVRQIESVNELADKGHAVYLSFYNRTKYSFRTDRKYPEKFREWANSLFRFQSVIILGAYRGNDLSAVSIAQVVEDTLIYSTIFAKEDALKDFVTDSLLHALRKIAAAMEGVKQVYPGIYHGGNGRDCFYLQRGIKLVTKPAFLRINPVASWILRLMMPNEYNKILGNFKK